MFDKSIKNQQGEEIARKKLFGLGDLYVPEDISTKLYCEGTVYLLKQILARQTTVDEPILLAVHETYIGEAVSKVIEALYAHYMEMQFPSEKDRPTWDMHKFVMQKIRQNLVLEAPGFEPVALYDFIVMEEREKLGKGYREVLNANSPDKSALAAEPA